MGAASFVVFAALVPGEGSPTRVAAQVVSGIGFLGAGLIFREGMSVRGLNTAATLWCSAAIGVLAGAANQVNPMPILMKHVRVQGIFVGSRAMFEDLNRFVTAAKIRPTIDRVFSFDQAREAYAYLESANHFGKVVIKVGD